MDVFQAQTTAAMVNPRPLAIRNKKVRCACCIYMLSCIKIDAVDEFRTEKNRNGRNKVFREKQATSNVLLFLNVKLLKQMQQQHF